MGKFENNSKAIRRAFLDFFVQRGHEEVPSSSLVPENDPTLLFANAGMNQFKDVFTGKTTRARTRATTAQKCVRAGGKHNDLENVGRTARHHTFFEMLGNFSFGDYFKEGAITFANELLCDVYGLPLERLCFTVHESDDEARRLWRKITGVPDSKILSLGDADNFWAMGEVGPCGPCSEIHFHQGDDLPCARVRAGQACLGPACDCDRWIEIWNLVFMQFEQLPDGRRQPLPKPSVDTGMGLERLSAVLSGVRSNYETDLLRPIIDRVATHAKCAFDPADYADGSPSVSLRAIADHARATAFLIADGVFPEKTGREYVLRRIMRRAVYHGHLLGLRQPFFAALTEEVAKTLKDVYPELGERLHTITKVTDQEERKFRETLDRGVRILEESSRALSGHVLPGDLAFKLYDTYGFPIDLTRVVASSKGLSVDEAGFAAAMEEQRRRAEFAGSGEVATEALLHTLADRLGETRFSGYDKTRAHGRVVALVLREGEGLREVNAVTAGAEIMFICDETPFYGESGGQVGDIGTAKGPTGKLKINDTRRPTGGMFVHYAQVTSGEIRVGDTLELSVDNERRDAIRRNHSATHLLHLALRRRLGEHVAQKGSRVAPDRLRFDFSHFAPLSPEERTAIEDMVNGWIVSNLPAVTQEMELGQAKQSGAVAFFGEKYGKSVRVLSIGESKELCGGTHVSRSGEIGLFKILEESGIAQGVRRIEAVTGLGALAWARSVETELTSAAMRLRVSPQEVAHKVASMQEELRQREREIEKLRGKLASGGGRDLAGQAIRTGGVSILVAEVPVGNAKILRETADTLRDKLDPGVVVLAGNEGDKLALVCMVTRTAVERFHAGKLLGELVQSIGGKGGGRPDLAQGGGPLPEDLPGVLGRWRETLQARANLITQTAPPAAS